MHLIAEHADLQLAWKVVFMHWGAAHSDIITGLKRMIKSRIEKIINVTPIVSYLLVVIALKFKFKRALLAWKFQNNVAKASKLIVLTQFIID